MPRLRKFLDLRVRVCRRFYALHGRSTEGGPTTCRLWKSWGFREQDDADPRNKVGRQFLLRFKRRFHNPGFPAHTERIYCTMCKVADDSYNPHHVPSSLQPSKWPPNSSNRNQKPTPTSWAMYCLVIMALMSCRPSIDASLRRTTMMSISPKDCCLAITPVFPTTGGRSIWVNCRLLQNPTAQNTAGEMRSLIVLLARKCGNRCPWYAFRLAFSCAVHTNRNAFVVCRIVARWGYNVPRTILTKQHWRMDILKDYSWRNRLNRGNILMRRNLSPKSYSSMLDV